MAETATEQPVARKGSTGRARFLWAACAVAYGILLVRWLWFARASTLTEFSGLPSVPGPDKIIVSFRNDDLSIYSDPLLEDSVLSLFRSHGVRQTFAFIPNPSGYVAGAQAERSPDPRMRELLQQWEREGMIEFAMHGFTHVKNGVGAGEFDGLPASVQDAMIHRGKALLDSTLGTDVRVFAPPWNQVDAFTVEACAKAGIDIVSGYMGVPPVHGVTPVNTNAELFHHPGEIPPVGRVLELARYGTGTRFVNVFYHSRVDFRTPEAFHHVDSLLAVLRADPDVETLTLGEITRRYPEHLRMCSESGWNIVEAEQAMNAARPFLAMLSGLPLIGSKVRELEERHTVALESYWCGEYAAAHLQAADVVRLSGNWLGAGRGVALLAAALFLGVIMVLLPDRRRVLIAYGIVTIPIVLLVIVFATISHVSPERIAEVGRLATIFVGALLLVLPFLPQLRSDRVPRTS